MCTKSAFDLRSRVVSSPFTHTQVGGLDLEFNPAEFGPQLGPAETRFPAMMVQLFAKWVEVSVKMLIAHVSA